ncbi:MAG: SOS response-associated peptidase family protein [Erythrobacter sp.]
MTTLYRLDAPAAAIADHFGARAGDDPWAGGYVAPGKFAPIITAGREYISGPRPPGGTLQPRMAPRLWGVLPPPAAHDPARRIATVRNPDSPFWIGNLRNSEFRCLVPATCVMLWGEGTDYEGRRLKHWFAPETQSASDQSIFAMAAVWKDEDIPAFAILTQGAAGAAKSAGATAMPVIVPADTRAQQDWLHGSWVRARAVIEGEGLAGLNPIKPPP